jgi:hypothetical protein
MPLYTRLREGSVRLLRLLPHPDEHSTIECQLFTCNLLDSESIHPYEALSYVWGPENNLKSIDLDSPGLKDKLPVRENLHAALSHLRDRFVERIIWTDAICINQEDNEEKGQQVQSMAKIYAKASRVIVWLGEAADNSDEALKAIRRIAEEQHTNSAIYKTNQEAVLAPPDQQPKTDQQAILKLLEREWFQRIWVSGRNQIYGQSLFTW